MNPFKLLDPAYLFDPRPGIGFSLFWPLVVFFIIIFVASYAKDKYLRKKFDYKIYEQFFSGVAAHMREFAIAGLVLTFFRDQNIPYFAMRFWLALLFTGAIVYIIWLWRYFEMKSKQTLVKSKKKALKDKYKPQAKKKSRAAKKKR